MNTVSSGTATSVKGIRARALAVIGAVALMTLCLGAGVASADGGRDHRNAENTFTKWITDFNAGTMAGVVGGDVGDGTYAGQITSFAQTSTGFVIDAAYHFNGSKHSFTASVHIVQTGFANGATAAIAGWVTEGWLNGNRAEGEYMQVACTQAPNGTCFQGTLDILRGTKSGD
jgi:hypothetical protein